MAVKTKAGGRAHRIIFEKVKNGDTATLPAGCLVRNVTLLKKGTTTGKLRIGTITTPPVALKVVVQINAQPTANGTLGITLKGSTLTSVPILDADTISGVVDKIVAASYAGWICTKKDTDEVYFECRTPGLLPSGSTLVFDAGGTGVTIVGPTEVTPAVNAIITDNVVASTAVGTVNNVLTNYTVSANGGKNAKVLRVGLVELSAGDTTGEASTASGTLVIELYKPF